MIISQQKRKENIAEYILYMWQTEDQIRSLGFDKHKIEDIIISKYDVSPSAKVDIRKWYADLMQMMDAEGIQKTGHLQIIKNIIIDLYDLHLRLLDMPAETQYQKRYTEALPHIQSLEKKMQNKSINEIDVCMHGLYAVLLLRLSNKEVSEGTTLAVKSFSSLMALLSQKYKEREKNPAKYI